MSHSHYQFNSKIEVDQKKGEVVTNATMILLLFAMVLVGIWYRQSNQSVVYYLVIPRSLGLVSVMLDSRTQHYLGDVRWLT